VVSAAAAALSPACCDVVIASDADRRLTINKCANESFPYDAILNGTTASPSEAATTRLRPACFATYSALSAASSSSSE
jgi:hypothetical protein